MKIIVISDTHNRIIKEEIPDGDMLIHCGDVSIWGTEKELDYHLSTMNNLSHKYKIWIAGNHDRLIESNNELKTKYKNLIYLEDSLVEIEGLKIYGTPWTSIFRNWSFMLSEEEQEKMFSKIPKCDILISHGPPRYILDVNDRNQPCGSSALRKKVFEIKPKFHLFGHIHESYGIIDYPEITFVNASIYNYMKENLAIILDI